MSLIISVNNRVKQISKKNGMSVECDEFIFFDAIASRNCLSPLREDIAFIF